MAANPAKIPDSGVKIPAFRSLAPDSGVSVGRGVVGAFPPTGFAVAWLDGSLPRAVYCAIYYTLTRFIKFRISDLQKFSKSVSR